MSDLPSALGAVRARPEARRTTPGLRCTRAALLGCAGLAGLLVAGCLGSTSGQAAREASRFYPPPPQTAHVIALGALRGTPAPSQAEVDLSLFLFGAEPSANLAIANPAGLVVRDQSILICDNALSSVLRWQPGGAALQIEPFDPPPLHPFAIDVAPNGDLLVCDREGVKRIDSRGSVVRTYALSAGGLKPGGVLAVGDTVWVTNLAAQQIEVFDGESGAFLRSIGAPAQGRRTSACRAVWRAPPTATSASWTCSKTACRFWMPRASGCATSGNPATPSAASGGLRTLRSDPMAPCS